MTDRGQQALHLSQDQITIGPSAMTWVDDHLRIDIDEVSTPHAQRIKGVVLVRPSAITDIEVPLTQDGAHVWRPFAPIATIEVHLNRPGWSWNGHGYFDANFGTRALEADFGYWTWGRFPLQNGATCFYDVAQRDGTPLNTAIHFTRDGAWRGIDAPPKAKLPRSPWMVRRETRADAGYRPHQIKPMLDAPFYNRAAIKTQIHGEKTIGVCEALDLDKFRGPWLMPILAVRVPRRAAWRV